MKKISDMPDFAAKNLLLAAQKRGLEIAGRLDAPSATLIGLVQIMVENNTGGLGVTAALMDVAKRK